MTYAYNKSPNIRVQKLNEIRNAIWTIQYEGLFPDEGDAWDILDGAAALIERAATIIAVKDDANQAITPEVSP